MSRKKNPELFTWLVPAEAKISGYVQVVAADEEGARNLADNLEAYDGDFMANVEWVDWGHCGTPEKVT